MSSHDLRACMFSAWYPQFRHLTFKTVLLSLPQDFVDYLVADGVHLLDDSEALAQRATDPYASDEDDWETTSNSSGAGQQPEVPQFTELIAQIRSAIAELGGKVVPKFTWSCPKDAVWMTLGHTLECSNPDEVVLLLKSSDRVAHDICHAADGSEGTIAPSGAATSPAAAAAETRAAGSTAGGTESAQQAGPAADSTDGAPAVGYGPGKASCTRSSGGGGGGDGSMSGAEGQVQHVLALRRWHDLRPEREFRCFVMNHELVGVSQRDVTEYYPSLTEDKEGIEHRILEFHEQHIQGRFPLSDYTYDVYVAATADAVKLVDFNPVGGTTAPLLFSWEELACRAPSRRGQLQGLPTAAPGEDQPAAAEGFDMLGAFGGGGGTPGAGAASAADAAPASTAAGASLTEGSADARSYLQQLRQVQVLSISDHQPDGNQHTYCDAAGDAASTEQQQEQQHAVPASVLPTVSPAPSFELRIITGPVAMRPNKLLYGVPYDFVDDSEGSALSMLRQQMGEGVPEELLAALRSQAA